MELSVFLISSLFTVNLNTGINCFFCSRITIETETEQIKFSSSKVLYLRKKKQKSLNLTRVIYLNIDIILVFGVFPFI